MTKQPHPHRERRDSITFVLMLLIVVTIFLALLTGCRPQRGCSGTHGMTGYSSVEQWPHGWIRCPETGVVCLFNESGKLICIYNEKS